MSTPKQNPDFIKNWLAGLDDEGLKEIQDGLRAEINKRNQSAQDSLREQSEKYIGKFFRVHSENKIIKITGFCDQNDLAMQCLWFCTEKRIYFGSDRGYFSFEIRGENIFFFSESNGILSLKEEFEEISEIEARQAFGDGEEIAWKEFFADKQ